MFRYALRASVLLSVATLSISGCSKSTTTTNSNAFAGCPTAAQGYTTNRLAGGMVQGVLVDGISGTRIDLSNIAGGEGVFVLVGGERYYAKPIDNRGNAKMNGEFIICDVPFTTTFPIFANVSGYMPFQSTISTANPGASTIGVTPGNIRLFKEGTATRDVAFRLYFNSAAVADADVRLEPTSTLNTFSKAGTFLAPVDSRLIPMTVKSGADGIASFASGQLVLGAEYKYTILPAPTNNLSTSTGTFVAGSTIPTATGLTAASLYEYRVELGSKNEDLKIVSCSTASQDFESTGAITYVFNRDVQVTNPDSLTVTMANNVAAVLTANTAANNASEQIAITVSGDKLILKPNFTTAPVEATERNIAVTFSTTSLRAALGENNKIKDLATLVTAAGASCSLTTRFFK